MSERQPVSIQQPAEGGNAYSDMVESMRVCRAAEYERARIMAMAKQHSRFEDRLAAEAAARSVRVQLRVPARQHRLQATPACAWDLIHYRMRSVRDAAVRLGIKAPAVLELLAEYKAVAEQQELQAMRAIDAAAAAGHR
jgi:hypothetical protein